MTRPALISRLGGLCLLLTPCLQATECFLEPLQEAWFEAAKKGDLDQLNALLRRSSESSPSLLNARNEQEATALIVAANNRRTAAVELLLKQGANPFLPDKFVAFFSEYLEDDELASGLWEQVYQYIKERGAYPHTQYAWQEETSPQEKLDEGFFEAPRQPPPSKSQAGPLLDRQLAQEALLRAIKKGSTQMALAFCAQGLDLNDEQADGQTALIYAIKEKQLQIALALITDSAELEAKDAQGRTALIWAIKNKQLKVALALITHGADVNAIDEKGRPPLIYAVRSKQLMVTKALIAHGADVHAIDQEGQTALSWVSKLKNKALMEKLQEAIGQRQEQAQKGLDSFALPAHPASYLFLGLGLLALSFYIARPYSARWPR